MHDLWWLILGLVFMSVISIFDIRTKQIPITAMIGIYILSFSYLVWNHDLSAMSIILSCLPGALFVFISIASRGNIGMGDALLIMGIGIGMGTERGIVMLTIALFANCIIVGGLFALHKVNKNTKIPFAPFLTFGMGVSAFVCR